MKKIVGQTKDAGFQIGVRRTVPVSLERVWDFLFSETGLKIWLGELVTEDFSIGSEYKTKESSVGTVKVIRPFSHIRLTWKRYDWQNSSTLQIRVIATKTGTTISFHQEKLLDSLQREEMKNHWNIILSGLTEELK